MKIKNSFLVFLLVLIMICNITYSKYYYSYSANIISPRIAVPVIEVWSQDKIMAQVSSDSNSEFSFSIRNYNGINISQVDMYYTIEVLSSNENFPVQFSLYDENHNQLVLTDNISTIFEISKESQDEDIFTLVATFIGDNTLNDIDTTISIRVNAWQKGV